MSDVGRPSDYDPELCARILELISDGVSLRKICLNDWAPHRVTVFRWIQAHSDFRSQYARAREAQAEKWADEIIDLADEAEDAQKARLQVDTRKWVLSKLLPKKYGERTTVEHASDPENPLTVLVSSAEELRNKIRGK